MFDREKSDPQTDIEFDFFDESPTGESTPPKERPPGKRRRLPKRPPSPPGGPQLYRLGVLIAGAILLAVIFILVINNCRGDQKQSAYEGYMEDVGVVATESEELGNQLNTRLTTPGIRLEARATSRGCASSRSRFSGARRSSALPVRSSSSRRRSSRRCSSG